MEVITSFFHQITMIVPFKQKTLLAHFWKEIRQFLLFPPQKSNHPEIGYLFENLTQWFFPSFKKQYYSYAADFLDKNTQQTYEVKFTTVFPFTNNFSHSFYAAKVKFASLSFDFTLIYVWEPLTKELALFQIPSVKIKALNLSIYGLKQTRFQIFKLFHTKITSSVPSPPKLKTF